MTNIYARGKVVGAVRDGEFRKTLSSSKHFLRKPPAIAFDISTLRDAQDAGAILVTVVDRDTGSIYQADLDDIFDYGFSLNRGYGHQLALNLNSWKKSNPD